ncbi:MAG: DUF2339 domain-containing protein [Gemmatimonadota bacterium]
MNSDERFERLEQRMAVLESLVRQLVGSGGAAGEMVAEKKTEQTERAEKVQPAELRNPLPARPAMPKAVDAWINRMAAPETAEAIGVSSPSAESVPPFDAPVGSTSHAPHARRDAEQWLGQRGLLAVGVTFLVLAAGYLLKLSFDRGWVSPLMRCMAGATAGLVVGAAGWRLHDRGLKTYGAAIVGCGAAILYLAIWAASRLYGFLPPATAIGSLALVSLALAALAYAFDVQALGATAVFGAFLAPVLLGQDASNANLLLIYVSCMAAALGWVAAARRWRLTMLLIAASFFVLGFTAEDHASASLLLAYAVLGGSAGLYVGLRDGWWETRFFCFSAGWTLLFAASNQLGASWLLLAGGLVLAAPVWWFAMRATGFWPLRPGTDPKVTARAAGETIYFFTTPVLLGSVLPLLNPEFFAHHPGLAPLLVAIPYLIAGYSRYLPEFALIGTSAVGYAALVQWSGLKAPLALLALALLWAGIDHLLKRLDGRWFSLLAMAFALGHLLAGDVTLRPSSEAAFTGPWALTLWASAVVLSVLAWRLWRRIPEERGTAPVPEALWTAAGALVFFGVTAELPRYFGARHMAADMIGFSSSLSVTVWWLGFSAAIFVLGLRLARRWIGITGLLGLVASAAYLVLIDQDGRIAGDAAFFGLWAGSLWLTIIVFAAMARMSGAWRAEKPVAPLPFAHVILWCGAGLLLLMGVTGELDRYFGQHQLEPSTAALASGLAISAWWIIFAAVLIVLGLRRAIKSVRIAGFVVAGLAVIKVMAFDLSSLDSLYRVGSFLIVGFVSLVIAYLYHRKARGEEA